MKLFLEKLTEAEKRQIMKDYEVLEANWTISDCVLRAKAEVLLTDSPVPTVLKMEIIAKAVAFDLAKQLISKEEEITKYKASWDTMSFINLMLNEDSFFHYINEMFDGRNDFIQRNKDKIYRFLTEFGYDIKFDLDKVEAGWVYNQLELGGLEKTDFTKDYSKALE